MVDWTPPLWRYTLGNLVAGFVVWSIMEAIYSFFVMGLSFLVGWLVLSIPITAVLCLILWWRQGELIDHELSFWKMDKDLVMRRLAHAMVERGARPPVQTREKGDWFLLPPLSIVVTRGWWRTKVYVGPSRKGTEGTVKRLEGFVERALT